MAGKTPPPPAGVCPRRRRATPLQSVRPSTTHRNCQFKLLVLICLGLQERLDLVAPAGLRLSALDRLRPRQPLTALLLLSLQRREPLLEEALLKIDALALGGRADLDEALLHFLRLGVEASVEQRLTLLQHLLDGRTLLARVRLATLQWACK